MNTGKVVFGFFILLSATLNFGFVYGDISEPDHHHVGELFAAIVVNLIATVLKLGDRTHLGAIHLATSLVADVQLLIAAGVWAWGAHVSQASAGAVTASVVSLAAAALLANIVSVLMMVTETLMSRR